MARLFVAAHPPPEVVERIAALPRPASAGVRWVPPQRWHVTLRFLGEADEAGAAAALAGLGAPRATARLGPAVSRLGRDVLCLPVAGLDDLAAAVVTATAGVGEPPEPRPFAGHLTLGRVRGRSCGLAGTRFAATFEVGEVALVRSVLGPGGTTHAVVATRALG